MSIAGVTERIAEIQSRMASLANLNTADIATSSAFSTELSSALSTAGTTAARTTTAVDGAFASGATDLQRQVIEAASTALDLPYVWGGNSLTTGVDCSGLVQQAFKTVGIELPRLSADQARSGTPVASMAEAQPGDLIAWDNSSRNKGADHIAIYLGDGKMIEAPYTGAKVRIVDVPSTPDYIRRVLPTESTTSTAGTGAVSASTLAAARATIPTTIGGEGVTAARSAFELQALFSGLS